MSKRLLFAQSARPGGSLHADLLAGVEELALAVGSTLGPRGRNVIIDRAGETPIVTKDGVTVARNIQLTNPVRNAAAKLIQDVARDTVNEAGDGTTTATVLAHRLFEGGLRLVAQGTSPVTLQRSIQSAAALVSQQIRAVAAEPTDEQIGQVATVSTNGNAAIGELILDAVRQVGRDGVLHLDDSTSGRTYLEVRDGFRFDSGWVDPSFITDKAHGTAVLENPVIFITERLLSQGIEPVARLHDLGPLFAFAAGTDPTGKIRERDPRPLLIIADDIAGDALTSAVVNHVNGNIRVCAVRAPYMGELRRAALSDMALATGGEVLTTDSGKAVSKWPFDGEGKTAEFTGKRLGTCRRAVISNGRTVLEGCAGDPADPGSVERFAASLRQQAKEATEPLVREQLLQRAGRLTGRVAALCVGAATEPEARALRDAIEDAVLAVRAALAEGIVAGGGLCLFWLSQVLRNTADAVSRSTSEQPVPGWAPPEAAQGLLLVADCLEAPLRQIAANAGIDPQECVDRVRALAKASGRMDQGYDAALNRYTNLLEAGIVDPAKVVRVALEKAASIAALMLTSSCLIYFDPDAVRPPASPIPPTAAR